MTLQIIMLLAGLALILFGANWLVDGSSSIAKRFGISEFVIGLTIVGIGTSSPEMVVSFMSSLQGKADMAIGNIVGSNIFNTLMILGITALVAPMAITKNNLKRDIPLNIVVTVLLIILGMNFTLFGKGQDVQSVFRFLATDQLCNKIQLLGRSTNGIADSQSFIVANAAG